MECKIIVGVFIKDDIVPLFLKQTKRYIFAASNLLKIWFSSQKWYVNKLDVKSKAFIDSFYQKWQSIIYKEIMLTHKISSSKINNNYIRHLIYLEIPHW